MAFMLLDPTTLDMVPRSFRKDDIMVLHDAARQDSFELVPMEAADSGQLFILVVDGSSSMFINEGERIKKVWSALLDKQVIDGFYPPEQKNKTGVVIVRFTDKVVGLDGGPPKVLTNRAQYTDMVKTHLMRQSRGYTHLYDAAKYAVTDLLQDKGIRDFLVAKSADPTIVLLTDGFNNEAASDTCQTNVDRLDTTLEAIKERMRGGSGFMPRLYTIGLGGKYRPGNKPKGFNQTVTPQGLCGRYINNKIDDGRGTAGLEDYGIDHISLEWLAEAGRGESFVANNPRGLAQVFTKAAAKRYRWYQLYYQVPDNFYHRKSFEIQVQLSGVERSFTKIKVSPSGWMDPPPGISEGRWTAPSSMRQPFALVMPIFGFLIFINFLGAATFNTRRALFRRAKARK
jgi:hypothetical protein